MKIQKTMVGGVVMVMFACLACGEDNDVLVNPPPPEPAPIVEQTGDNTDDELDDADQLASGGDAGPDEVAVSECDACPAPPMGVVSCCTIADDVAAVRATEAGQCGIDFGGAFAGCTQLAQPGVLDAACPPVEFPPGAPPMQGCCTEAGHCGAMETFMGLGCTSNPDQTTWVACGG